MFTSIKGKIAIITGAGTGAGLGIAKAYVKEGVAVVITGRTESKLLAAKAALEALVPDAQVLPLVADNTDHTSAQYVVDQTIERFGKLDILINKEDFALVQKKMLTRRKKAASNTAHETYLLSGKVVCGLCGATFAGNSRHTTWHHRQYVEYRCNRKGGKIKCSNKGPQRNLGGLCIG